MSKIFRAKELAFGTAGEARPHWLIIAARLKKLRKTNFMCEVRT
jgi:hypothetical protein